MAAEEIAGEVVNGDGESSAKIDDLELRLPFIDGREKVEHVEADVRAGEGYGWEWQYACG